MLGQADLQLLQERGIAVEEVNRQIKLFEQLLMDVQFQIGDHGQRRSYGDRFRMRRFSNQERNIAMRMAHMSGLSKREILRMRGNGMSWQRIGWRIGLDHQELRAATAPKYGHNRYRRPFVNRGYGHP